jgi:hypothetical protein
LIRPGLIAWADIAPGFQPPGPHPLLVFKAFANGNVAIAFISHSTDLSLRPVALTRENAPSAFREYGGPLTGDRSAIHIRDQRGLLTLTATPTGPRQLIAAGCVLTISHLAQLPPAEWHPIRDRIQALL